MNEHGPMSDAATRDPTLSERTAAVASDLLAGRRRGWRNYGVFVGPAVVASIAYMDPGNFATNIQAGAKYGYGLLWVVLLANLGRNAVPGARCQARHRHRPQSR